jgi:hypothetical protein
MPTTKGISVRPPKPKRNRIVHKSQPMLSSYDPRVLGRAPWSNSARSRAWFRPTN